MARHTIILLKNLFFHHLDCDIAQDQIS